MTQPTGPQPIAEFVAEARDWLDDKAERLPPSDRRWGEGTFSVAVFHRRSPDDEQAHLEAMASWHQRKATDGYHAISWDPAYGGLGLPPEYELAFAGLETEYKIPARHELFGVTTGLVAPTVLSEGTPAQRERFVVDFLTASQWCCQLFSEPGAGSDLASLGCRAEADGDEWVLNGQKVWSSGAQFSQWGLLIARSDPSVAKHRGMTAFLVPLDAQGVEVRPVKQMTGSTSFNEVFLSDARIGDDLRLGDVGGGWKVALTTLAHERASSSRRGASRRPGGSADDAIATAVAFEATDDPIIRQQLARVQSHERVRLLTAQRVAAARQAGQEPGPEGSIGKQFWVEGLPQISQAASGVLGPRLTADTGEWGSYEWGEHVLGAPGYRIAGGSDEIQRNIIGERVLGLPGEPRLDRDTPWNELPR